MAGYGVRDLAEPEVGDAGVAAVEREFVEPVRVRSRVTRLLPVVEGAGDVHPRGVRLVEAEQGATTGQHGRTEPGRSVGVR
jgi:hypothetical protein